MQTRDCSSLQSTPVWMKCHGELFFSLFVKYQTFLCVLAKNKKGKKSRKGGWCCGCCVVSLLVDNADGREQIKAHLSIAAAPLCPGLGAIVQFSLKRVPSIPSRGGRCLNLSSCATNEAHDQRWETSLVKENLKNNCAAVNHISAVTRWWLLHFNDWREGTTVSPPCGERRGTADSSKACSPQRNTFSAIGSSKMTNVVLQQNPCWSH